MGLAAGSAPSTVREGQGLAGAVAVISWHAAAAVIAWSSLPYKPLHTAAVFLTSRSELGSHVTHYILHSCVIRLLLATAKRTQITPEGWRLAHNVCVCDCDVLWHR